MNLSQFLLILRAHYKIILLALIVTVATTVTVTLLKQKTYKATTSLVLNYKGTDPVTGNAMPSQLMPGYMSTQIEIVKSMSVALKVVDTLKLAEGEDVKKSFAASAASNGNIRDWVAAALLGKLEIAPSRESSVLSITYTSLDPQSAARIANAFGDAYQQVIVKLKVDPSKKTSVYFNDQVKLLRDNYEAAQKKLSKYQQDNGIVNADKSLDVESMRLNQLSSQLVAAQGEAMEASSRQRLAKGNAADSPDVASNPLIQNLKMGLGNAESKFSEIAQRLDKNHPQYQSAKAEADKLRADLNAQISAAANVIGSNAAIQQQRGAEIRGALAAQKLKVLQLNRTRDELAVLSRDVDSAQRAYETISQRLTLTNLEGQSNQSDIAVLTPALAPLKPFGPNLLLNTLMAIAVGALLGIGSAVILELLDRRVRSAADLAGADGLAVLGVIKKSNAVARRQSNKQALTRRDPPIGSSVAS
ncbi:MAG: chain length determinant protein EpsF [Oxalobacteraceae bacterium]|nr:chain length determinant protein EpsF [Oxalobacteraceae bacterium]